MHGSKAASVEEALTHIRSGQTIMLSGFTNVGSPNKFIVKMAEAGITDIDLISNDAGNDHTDGIGTLICQHRVRRLTASHVGLNPKVAEQMNAGTLEVVLVPQGTLAERIRCGGTGLGGVLTKTGLGTVVEEGKQIIEVNGESYLLETALRADIALTRCRRADPLGNLAYSGSSGHASHPVIATCGALSIVECDHFCDLGELGPDKIKVPGMFVDMILA